MPTIDYSYDYDKRYGARTPGVYVQREFTPRGLPKFLTGVPVFIGTPAPGSKAGPFQPVRLSLWSQYRGHFGEKPVLLSYAVRGFFENGGDECYVVPVPEPRLQDYSKALDAISELEDADLLAVPEYPITGDGKVDRDAFHELQREMIRRTSQGSDRFAILDSLPGDTTDEIIERCERLDGGNAALYYPWVEVSGAGDDPAIVQVPPSGIVAGVYTRTDRRIGVHKAPANEVAEGVSDTSTPITLADQNRLSEEGVNYFRAMPGLDVRIWGARTVSGHAAREYVSVRRVVITVLRWVRWSMRDVAFERNSPGLPAGIEREITSYLMAQFRAGALKGRSPEEAFYVVSRPSADDTVETEIGLAPAVPFEYIIVRLIHGESGVV